MNDILLLAAQRTAQRSEYGIVFVIVVINVRKKIIKTLKTRFYPPKKLL